MGSSYGLVKKLKSRIYFSSSYFFFFFFLTKERMESSSLTRASITRVPTTNLTSAEEIAPRCKEFTRTTPTIDADADVQAPSKVKQRVNFFQNFLSRRKRNEGNVNNNGFSLSDVASAVGSAVKDKSKSSSKKKSKSKKSATVKGCCC